MGHLCKRVIDCLRQLSQKRWPHFVVTKVRPDCTNVLLVSIQIGHVISCGLEVAGSSGWLGGVEVAGPGAGGNVSLPGGVDGMTTTSLSSDSDMTMAFLVLLC